MFGLTDSFEEKKNGATTLSVKKNLTPFLRKVSYDTYRSVKKESHP